MQYRLPSGVSLPQSGQNISAALSPGRRVVVARELTKLHEEVTRGTAEELAGIFTGRRVRGEITLLIRGVGRRGGGGSA